MIDALHLRPMLHSDVAEVLAIEVLAYSHPWSSGNFADSVNAGHWAEVLLAADGRISAYFVAMPGVEELHLLNIAVAPQHQGQGLGQRLMKVVQNQARRHQLPTLWLEVRDSNQRARSLYRRLGFVEVGLRRAYYPGHARREDAVVMRLDVGADPTWATTALHQAPV
jgi:[ribosomal protein S18]-alanine N-acetyltransferase